MILFLRWMNDKPCGTQSYSARAHAVLLPCEPHVHIVDDVLALLKLKRKKRNRCDEWLFAILQFYGVLCACCTCAAVVIWDWISISLAKDLISSFYKNIKKYNIYFPSLTTTEIALWFAKQFVGETTVVCVEIFIHLYIWNKRTFCKSDQSITRDFLPVAIG